MKTFSFFILSLLCAVLAVDAQPLATDSVKSMELGKAYRDIRRVSSPSSQQEAYSLFLKYASQGDMNSMYQLHRCLLNGWGIEKNPLEAVEWLDEAAGLGYEAALAQLVNIYKQGQHGVVQDLSKAFGYAVRLAERGSPVGYYQSGYLLYKGLGCQQDYSRAMLYFEKGTLAGHGASMYMLGLGYRNGYGVPVDLPKAKSLFVGAAEKGVSAAQLELQIPQSENMPSAVGFRSVSAGANPPSAYPQVRHRLDGGLPGCYSGTLCTYDWSGKSVIERNALSLEIAVSGDEVTIHWLESAKEGVTLHGLSTDTLILFDKGDYRKSDRYAPSKTQTREFVDSRLSVATDGGKTILRGTVGQRSPETMEPERPMCFVAEKISALTLRGNGNDAVALTTSPNPFSDVVRVSFTLSRPDICRLSLYSSTGMVVFDKPLGSLGQGSHVFDIRPDVVADTYVLKLVYGDNSCVSTLVKEHK